MLLSPHRPPRNRTAICASLRSTPCVKVALGEGSFQAAAFRGKRSLKHGALPPASPTALTFFELQQNKNVSKSNFQLGIRKT